MSTPMNKEDIHPTVYAVVLAAGQAARFGATKQLTAVAGVPLVRRVFETATEACGEGVIAVVGHDAAAVVTAMRAKSGFVVVNEAFEAGLGSSIAAAARACPPAADALLLLLADQVLVTSEHLETLMRAWSGAPNEIVATAFADTEGPPVLMPRDTFAELRGLRGETGARALFSDRRFRLKTVCFEDAAVDIDTRDDLTRI